MRRGGTFLDDFEVNETTDSDEEVTEPPMKRRRGSNRIWLKDADLNSSKEAEESIDTSLWKKCVYICSVDTRSMDLQRYPPTIYDSGVLQELLFHATKMKLLCSIT